MVNVEMHLLTLFVFRDDELIDSVNIYPLWPPQVTEIIQITHPVDFCGQSTTHTTGCNELTSSMYSSSMGQTLSPDYLKIILMANVLLANHQLSRIQN